MKPSPISHIDSHPLAAGLVSCVSTQCSFLRIILGKSQISYNFTPLRVSDTLTVRRERPCLFLPTPQCGTWNESSYLPSTSTVLSVVTCRGTQSPPALGMATVSHGHGLLLLGINFSSSRVPNPGSQEPFPTGHTFSPSLGKLHSGRVACIPQLFTSSIFPHSLQHFMFHTFQVSTTK